MKHRFLIYFYIFIIQLISPFISKADQLSVLTKAEADKAVLFLAKQESIIMFCGCCGGDSKIINYITRISIEPFADTKDFQIVIEGISENMEKSKGWIDLAYVHINKGGLAVCVALELGFECDPCVKPFKWPTKRKSISTNKIYIGTNSYDATPSISFSPSMTENSVIGDVQITVGKKVDGGVIMIELPNFNEGVSGNLVLYLTDGNAIQCIDRKIRDIVDGKSIAVYHLTFADIAKLKKSNVKKIRFSINSLLSGIVNLTATNNDEEISIYIKLLF
jgi:hypothetical protein